MKFARITRCCGFVCLLLNSCTKIRQNIFFSDFRLNNSDQTNQFLDFLSLFKVCFTEDTYVSSMCMFPLCVCFTMFLLICFIVGHVRSLQISPKIIVITVNKM